MLWMLLFLLISLSLAGAVALYVAYPRRGEDVPHAPWLGDAMMRGVEALPTLDNQPHRQPLLPQVRRQLEQRADEPGPLRPLGQLAQRWLPAAPPSEHAERSNR